ncbi:MAG: PD-(D/E)XK motif protein [Roseobacter sp.]|uniref:PD-(D/E)XK motif protein n=1 Tax=Hyphomonas sp. TaxID=87 RepID=UPI0032985270
MKSNDPWKDIPPSPAGSSVIGHLVLESRPHEVFRARDASGRRVLFLVHDPASMSSTSLPRMAGLEVEVEIRDNDGQAMLSVRLENQDDADIFARFCEDIVMTISNARDEISAVQAFLGRTWKWHALLKGARKKTLSREDQLGLIGELRTMSDTIRSVKGLGTALEAWRGSENAPKDFELAGLCIECKARGASSRGKVRISSEHQLADEPGQELVLLVHTFATADRDAVGAIDLHSLVSSIRSRVSSERPDLSQMLEEKLEEAGYEDEHEYDVIVVHKSTESYSVIEGFPRIVPGNYQEGPTEVSYDLPLAQISHFRIGRDELVRLIEKSE